MCLQRYMLEIELKLSLCEYWWIILAGSKIYHRFGEHFSDVKNVHSSSKSSFSTNICYLANKIITNRFTQKHVRRHFYIRACDCGTLYHWLAYFYPLRRKLMLPAHEERARAS